MDGQTGGGDCGRGCEAGKVQPGDQVAAKDNPGSVEMTGCMSLLYVVFCCFFALFVLFVIARCLFFPLPSNILSWGYSSIASHPKHNQLFFVPLHQERECKCSLAVTLVHSAGSNAGISHSPMIPRALRPKYECSRSGCAPGSLANPPMRCCVLPSAKRRRATESMTSTRFMIWRTHVSHVSQASRVRVIHTDRAPVTQKQ